MELGKNNFLLLTMILMIASVSLMAEGARAAAVVGTPEAAAAMPEAEAEAGQTAETGEEEEGEEGEGSGDVEPLSVKYIEKIKASKKTAKRIKTICEKCKNNELCEHTVLEVNKEVDPRKLNPVNVVDLQLASMLEVIELASMDCAVLTHDKGNELCEKSYGKALEKLSDAMWACEEAVDPEKAMAKVAPFIPKAMKHIDSCQAELKISNKSPLLNVNDYLIKLGKNCVALCNE